MIENYMLSMKKEENSQKNITQKNKRRQRSISPNKAELMVRKEAGLPLTLDQKRMEENEKVKEVLK